MTIDTRNEKNVEGFTFKKSQCKGDCYKEIYVEDLTQKLFHFTWAMFENSNDYLGVHELIPCNELETV